MKYSISSSVYISQDINDNFYVYAYKYMIKCELFKCFLETIFSFSCYTGMRQTFTEYKIQRVYYQKSIITTIVLLKNTNK